HRRLRYTRHAPGTGDPAHSGILRARLGPTLPRVPPDGVPVLTASNWQVRQPLYSTSSGRWRNYRQWLGPMIASLGLDDPDAWSPWERRTSPVRREQAKAQS